MNLVKYAEKLNKVSSLYLTGLDALDELDKIKLCKTYKRGDEIVEGTIPTIIDEFGKLEPVYTEVDGWK